MTRLFITLFAPAARMSGAAIVFLLTAGRGFGAAALLSLSLLPLAAQTRSLGCGSTAPAGLAYAYAPYRQNGAPPFEYHPPEGGPVQILGLQPTRGEVLEDANLLKAGIGEGALLRVYDVGEPSEILAENGFCLIVSVPLASAIGRDAAADDAAVLARLKKFLDRYRSRVAYLLVGNETQAPERSRTEDGLLDMMRQVRQVAGDDMPLSAAEIYSTWFRDGQLNTRLLEAVDVVSVHLYPYFDQVKAEEGATYLYRRLDELRAAMDGAGVTRPIAVTETGFPAAGRALGEAAPSPDALGRYLVELLAFAQLRPEYRITWFTFVDNYWQKVVDENKPPAERLGAEGSFGILTWDRRIRPQIRHLFPPLPEPVPESTYFRVFERGQLCFGCDAGVYSTAGAYDSLKTEGTSFVFRKRDGDCNAGFYVTRGVPSPNIPRTSFVDLSNASSIALLLHADQPASVGEVFLKDADSKDDGLDVKVAISGVGPTARWVVIPLTQFSTAERQLNLARLYVLFGINMVGGAAQSIAVDKVVFVPRGATAPASELAFARVERPRRGVAELYSGSGACLDRWLSLNVATSGNPNGVLSTDPAEPGALKVCAASDYAAVYFQVGTPDANRQTNWQDWSWAKALSFDARRVAPTQPVFRLGIQDRTQTAGPQVRLPDIGVTWTPLSVPLDQLARSADLRELNVPASFILERSVFPQECLYLRNIRFGDGSQAAPQLARVTPVAPASGLLSGGTKVIVQGTGLSAETKVFFNSQPATGIRDLGSGRLEVITPAGSGRAIVTVRNPDGKQDQIADAFLFQALQAAQPTLTTSLQNCQIRAGQITGVNMPHEARLVVFASTNMAYLQPCGAAEPSHPIDESGRFGAIDSHSGSINVLLVPRTYVPPVTSPSLPAVDGVNILLNRYLGELGACDVARCRAN